MQLFHQDGIFAFFLSMQFFRLFDYDAVIPSRWQFSYLCSLNVQLIIMQLFRPDGILAVYLSMQFFRLFDYDAVILTRWYFGSLPIYAVFPSS